MSDMVENYLALARNASIAGNYGEALNYYNKVLELEPTNYIAWYGKGEAVGWMSTVQTLRLNELFVCFENAIRFSSNNPSLIKNCALKINEIATACYSICRNHMQEFIALNNAWVDYLSQCSQIISAYEIAHVYDSNDSNILKNIITLCEDNIKGMAYKDEFDNNASKAVSLSPEYEQEMRDKIALYGEKLKIIEPDYQIPNPVAAKPESACFVVAATMGNEDNFIINDLRNFRDSWLRNSSYGRKFIDWYYRNGPVLANFIRGYCFFRMLSFAFIVFPCWALSSVLLKFSKK